MTGQPTAAEKDLRFNVPGFFVQDDWKIKHNLTLNLGLRWEYFSSLTEAKGNLSNPILGSGAAALTGRTIHEGGNLFETSKNNWGPQLGFAWSPVELMGHDLSNKLVLRGGFGVGYNLQQLATTSTGRFSPPFMVSLDLFGSDILYTVNSDVHRFTGWPFNPTAVQTFDPTSGLPDRRGTGEPDRFP